MSSIQFFGAAGTVTGSCYLLTHKNFRLLIDCGMFQGIEEVEALNRLPLQFDPSQIDAVILTHAHLDHCGRLPLLAKSPFTAPIYMTQATSELLDITLADAAKIANHNHGDDALYQQEHVDTILDQIRIAHYHQPIDIGPWQFTFFDAGHILGSASILLKSDAGEKIIFSGDLGNTPQDLIRPTETFSAADIVVMESTYGDRLHSKQDANQILQHEINMIEKSQGTLLIPAFSIERTQELLHRLDHLKSEQLINPDTTIFLDSPMAIKVTQVFQLHHELFNQELQSHLKTDDPFDFPGLEVCLSHKDSLQIHKLPGPKVIIAGSGMMTGGRILRHAKNYLGNRDTRLLFVGYQGVDTLGRQIQEGAKSVEIDDSIVSVRASIQEITAMSSHADQKQLLNWLTQIKSIKNIILTHGEDESRQVLSQKIQPHSKSAIIHTPLLNDQINF